VHGIGFQIAVADPFQATADRASTQSVATRNSVVQAQLSGSLRGNGHQQATVKSI